MACVLALVLIAALPSPAMSVPLLFGGHWPDLQMTYWLSSGCRIEPRRSYILDAIATWTRWLPQATWTENTTTPARVTFTCKETAKASGNSDGITNLLVSNGLYTSAEIVLGTNTWNAWETVGASAQLIADYAHGLVVHEMGHSLGLPDMYSGGGGIMSQERMENCLDSSCHADPVYTGIPMPTQDELNSILAPYGSAITTATAETAIDAIPTPEMPTPIIVLLPILILAIMLLKRRNIGKTS